MDESLSDRLRAAVRPAVNRALDDGPHQISPEAWLNFINAVRVAADAKLSTHEKIARNLSMASPSVKYIETVQRERAPIVAQALASSAKLAAVKNFHCGLCSGVFKAREFIEHQSVDCARKPNPKPTRAEMALFGHEMGVACQKLSAEGGFVVELDTCALCGQTYEQIIAPTVPLTCEPDARWDEYKQARAEHRRAEREELERKFAQNPCNLPRPQFVKYIQSLGQERDVDRAMSIDLHHNIAERVAPWGRP